MCIIPYLTHCKVLIIADKTDSSKMFLKPGERKFSIPFTKLDNDAFVNTSNKIYSGSFKISKCLVYSESKDNN